MYRMFLLLTLAALMAACGAPPAAVAPTPGLPILPTPAATSAPAENPAAADQPVTAPATEPEPTAELPTADAALPEATRNGYATLVLLKGMVGLLGQLAPNDPGTAQAGAQSLGATLARRVAIAAAMKVIDDSLAQGPPDPALSDAWARARAAAPKIRAALDQAADGQAGGDTAAQLAPLQADLDEMLAGAGQALLSKYGHSAANQLQQAEAAGLARLGELLHPTPTQ